MRSLFDPVASLILVAVAVALVAMLMALFRRTRSGTWGIRQHLAAIVSIFLLLTGQLVLTGCGKDAALPTPVAVPTPLPPSCQILVNGDNVVINGCGNTTITNPSPSPSPGQAGSGTSDVKGFGQFLYGYDNVSGKTCTPPASKVLDSGAFAVPANCIADITATTFTDKDLDGDGKNDYAKDASRNLKWTISGPAVLLPGINGEPLFNQRVLPTGTGIVSVKAEYVDSAGVKWEVTKNYSVNG